MLLVLRQIARMEAIEIPHIETTQHATLGHGPRDMVRIRTLDHRGVQRGFHVDAAGTKRRDQSLPLDDHP